MSNEKSAISVIIVLFPPFWAKKTLRATILVTLSENVQRTEEITQQQVLQELQPLVPQQREQLSLLFYHHDACLSWQLSWCP